MQAVLPARLRPSLHTLAHREPGCIGRPARFVSCSHPASALPGECEALEGELREAKASMAELQGERDELAGQLGQAEAEAQNNADCLEQAK